MWLVRLLMYLRLRRLFRPRKDRFRAWYDDFYDRYLK